MYITRYAWTICEQITHYVNHSCLFFNSRTLTCTATFMPSCGPKVKHVNRFHTPNKEKNWCLFLWLHGNASKEWPGMTWTSKTRRCKIPHWCTSPSLYWPGLHWMSRVSSWYYSNMLCKSLGMAGLSIAFRPVKLLALVIANEVSTDANKKHHLI